MRAIIGLLATSCLLTLASVPAAFGDDPPASKEEALRMAKLAGGKDKLMDAAQTALNDGDPQWLADCLIALDPASNEPKLLKADALTALGYRTVTATARNYYLTVACEM